MIERHHLVGLPGPVGTVHLVEAVVVLALEGISETLQGVFESTGQERAVEEPSCVGFQRVRIAVNVVETDLALDQTITLGEFLTERQYVIDARVESSFGAHVCLTR
ncbi:hypothetical protein [Halosimplex aquaticum]|uniref:hypothetical protein n=1 Tax=Halosimplex aquaticum TaxID=3026162 RepID=UPI002368A3D3|nr:hypothetical protein [Halosimplex aquaticum]